ncbi:MAG: protoporphyrinogen/coproporphyrinogen oxidase, partial [Lentisphaeria bacterium]
MHFDIIIIGAGLTGLTTGYYLNKAEKKILIIDTRSRVGGVIETAHEDNFTYELGPNTGVIADIIMQDFFDEIVDEQCQLEIANAKNVKNRYIAFKGKWHKIPATPIGGLLTPLFSWRDKFSLPFEPFRKRGINPDETLAEMVVRRMGKSFLDHVID